jgi:hypothetical protein
MQQVNVLQVTALGIMIVVLGCGRARVDLGSETGKYTSIREARSHMPIGCERALYVIDGRPQEDSTAAYALHDEDVRAVHLVFGSGLPKCPAVMIETQHPKGL